MITHHNGDVVKAILNGDLDVLLHQANCQNTMNSGIAKQIRETIPEAYEADTLEHEVWGTELGEWTMANIEHRGFSTGRKVFNLYGQDGYKKRREGKQDTVHWALFKALTSVKRCLSKSERIGLPYDMGCHLGGGNWSLVEKFIEIEYADYDVHIYKL